MFAKQEQYALTAIFFTVIIIIWLYIEVEWGLGVLGTCWFIVWGNPGKCLKSTAALNAAYCLGLAPSSVLMAHWHDMTGGLSPAEWLQ